MAKQKPIITYASDLETIMRAVIKFEQIQNKTLPAKDAGIVFDDFHKEQAPMLRNYTEVRFVREILENFEKALERNYPGQY